MSERTDVDADPVCLQHLESGRWVYLSGEAVRWQRHFDDATVFRDARTAYTRMKALGINVHDLVMVAARA